MGDQVDTYFKEIVTNIKELDRLFNKRVEYQQGMNRTESLDTFLFGNQSNKFKSINDNIKKLSLRNKLLSDCLYKLGWVVQSTDYTLVPVNENKVHGVSAMYNMRVQYQRNW